MKTRELGTVTIRSRTSPQTFTGHFWRKAAGYGHVRSRRQNGHATPVGSGLSLTLNVHHGRGYRRDRDFMYYPLIISASVPIAVQVIQSVNIGSQRQGTHRSRVSEPTIPDRDYPYRHPTELILCDQLTQMGVRKYLEHS